MGAPDAKLKAVQSAKRATHMMARPTLEVNVPWQAKPRNGVIFPKGPSTLGTTVWLHVISCYDLLHLALCNVLGVPTQFLDKRIKFIFGRDKWIRFKFWG